MLPALRAWAPQLLIISAGFDAHRDDPLAGLQLLDTDFYWINSASWWPSPTKARNGRIVSILEGGYSMQGLAQRRGSTPTGIDGVTSSF